MIGVISPALGLYLKELPWVFIPTLFLGAIAFLFVTINAVREYRNSSGQKRLSRELYRKFEKEWDELIAAREMFRNTTNRAFFVWRKEVSIVGDLMQLVGDAGVPGIVLLPQEDLYGYAERAIVEWRGKRNQLLGFCIALYPPQGNSPLLTPVEEKAFHESRRVLSKFWDEWGRRIFVDKAMTLNDIPPNLAKSQARMVVLLSYIEVAYARYTRETSPGKRHLFEIGKAWDHYLKNQLSFLERKRL